MKDYCSCGFRRIEQTFLTGGVVYCVDCREPLCCDAVLFNPTVETHPAEIANEDRFSCWRHWDSVADLVVSHAFQ